MKKHRFSALVFALCLCLSMVSCGAKKDPSESDIKTTTTNNSSDVDTSGDESDSSGETTSESTGETSSTNPNTPNPSTPGKTSQGIPFNKTVTFTVMMSEHPSQKINPSGLKYEALFEKTNVKLKFDITPQASYNEKKSSALAAGVIPDITWVYSNDVKRNADRGIFMDLTPHLEKDLPNYYRFVKDDINWKKTNVNNKTYGFITVNAGEYPTRSINDRFSTINGGIMPVIRYDILEKHNLKVPTTFDEWFKVMKQLKTLYPESSPWSGRIGGSQAITNMAFAMGYAPGLHYNYDTKQYMYGFMQSEFRSIVEFFRTCWEEGIMDNNMWNANANLWTENMISSNSFFWFDNSGFAYSQNLMLQESNPKANLQIMPLMKNSKGKKQSIAYSNNWYTQMYTLSAKSTQKAELLKFMNWCYSDEGMFVNNYGKEGVSFTKNSKGEVTIPESLAKNYRNNPSAAYNYSSDLGVGMLSFTPLVHTNNALGKALGIENSAYDKILAPDVKAGNYKEQFTDIVLNNATRVKVQAREDAIFTLWNSKLKNFIDGTTPMSEYDGFVAQAKALGSDEVLKAYNQELAKLK